MHLMLHALLPVNCHWWNKTNVVKMMTNKTILFIWFDFKMHSDDNLTFAFVCSWSHGILGIVHASVIRLRFSVLIASCFYK